jgi:hypothetical protein
MIEEFEPNNIDNPLPNETFTAAQAIEAVNRLLWSEDVEDDNYEDARLIKAFLVGTLPNIPVPVKHSKTIPVMETTIEGAQRRIKPIIEWYDDYPEGNPWGTDLEYIGVFIDSVGDEMAAMSTAHNSLHERFVQALAAIDEWKDNFETVDMASARRLDEKIELQKEIDELNAELDRRLATAEKLQEERDDLHARWLQACANEETLRQANINLIHAAHDNR